MTRTTLLTLLLLCSVSILWAQPLILSDGCAFGKAPRKGETVYTNVSSVEIRTSLQKILDQANLRQSTFELKSSNVNTAIATVIDGRRYILYSEEFIRSAEYTPQSEAVVLSILAHEIGHHLLDHDFTITDPERRRLMELEADEYSGGLLRDLCVKREHAAAALKELFNANHPYYPPVSARIEFVNNGWIRKDEAIRREGRDPCGQVIPLDGGAVYGKINRAQNVKALVKEEEMIIQFDAIGEPGRTFSESFLVTPRYSRLTPRSIEWTSDRDKFGEGKEVIWHFGRDGYTRDQVMKQHELGVGVFRFGKVPRPQPFGRFAPAILTVVAGTGGLIYGLNLHSEAHREYDQYATFRNPENAFYAELGMDREQFFADTEDKHDTALLIRNGSAILIGAGLALLVDKYLWHRKGKKGMLYLGDDGVGMRAHF